MHEDQALFSALLLVVLLLYPPPLLYLFRHLWQRLLCRLRGRQRERI